MVPHDGIWHHILGIGPKDQKDVYKRQEQGISPTSPPVEVVDPGGEWDGARAFYATDPDGRTIEFVTMRAQPPALSAAAS